jgi:RNA polymerase sigma-70 factor (ECF subfamily)
MVLARICPPGWTKSFPIDKLRTSSDYWNVLVDGKYFGLCRVTKRGSLEFPTQEDAMLTFPRAGMTTKLEQEIEHLFRENYAMLYRTAYSMLDNPSDAEDVPQTIFLRLLRSGLPPDLQKNPKGYLYRAAVNLSLDIIRNRKRQRLTDAADYSEIAVDAVRRSGAEDAQEQVADVFAALPSDAAHLLILRYLHNHTEAEIAKLLNSSRGAVAMRLFRARALFKKHLRKSVGEKR